ncbi:hypothetical protein Lalb_Chr06g0172401 [Lupinus albus]|uniref:Uncharacterized protein n=1 Tax=Lupinus albus TaxID=3870 RepID=A0A6A4QEW8_LUPAL|nr:hypothetical protein Lalb_Chr06g0172401 [Lupinus albus]
MSCRCILLSTCPLFDPNLMMLVIERRRVCGSLLCMMFFMDIAFWLTFLALKHHFDCFDLILVVEGSYGLILSM